MFLYQHDVTPLYAASQEGHVEVVTLMRCRLELGSGGKHLHRLLIHTNSTEYVNYLYKYMIYTCALTLTDRCMLLLGAQVKFYMNYESS